MDRYWLKIVLVLGLTSSPALLWAQTRCEALFSPADTAALEDLARLKVDIERIISNGQKSLAVALEKEYTRRLKYFRDKGMDLSVLPELIEKARQKNTQEEKIIHDKKEGARATEQFVMPWSSHALTENEGVKYKAAAFSPNGKKILLVSDFDVSLWDETTGKKNFIFEDSASAKSAHFTPDGKEVFIQMKDGKAGFWNSQTGKSVMTPARASRQEEISPTGMFSARFSESPLLEIFNRDFVTKKLVKAFDVSGFIAPIRNLLYARDGRSLMIYGGSGISTLWNIETRNKILEIADERAELTPDFFNPDHSRYLVLNNNNLAVRDTKSRALLRDLKISKTKSADFAQHFGFTQDGLYIFAVTTDLQMIVWDSQGYSEVLRTKAHNEDITEVALSPTENKIVTVSRDKTVRIWFQESHREP